MLEFIVDGKPAVVKSGCEFEFVRENPEFSDVEGFTLGIDFPVCAENALIFGNVHRSDMSKPTTLLPCEIRSAECVLRGALAVVDVSEVCVKGQFLEGVVSDHEDQDIDLLYINELDLGKYPETDPKKRGPRSALHGTASEVCYPWQPIGYDVVNCLGISDTEWHEETRSLSWQPYLMTIIERVILRSGYKLDIHDLKLSVWQTAVICNTLPPTWGVTEYAKALPHWTVREFLDRMGLFLKGTFSIDESGKTIGFSFYQKEDESVTVLSEIVDEYSSTVNRDEKDADYLPIKRMRYRSQDVPVWKYLDAPWIHSGNWKIAEFDNKAAYDAECRKQNAAGHRVGEFGNFIYLRDVDTYFVPRRVQIYSKGHVDDKVAEKYPYASWYELQPVNVFGPPGYDRTFDYEELDVLPVAVDYALEGKMMWLPVSQFEDADGYVDGGDAVLDFGSGIKLSNGVTLADSLSAGLSRMESAVENHDESIDSEEYFSEIYIGMHYTDVFYPLTDTDVYGDRINADNKLMRLGEAGIEIDPCVKYTFKFLYDGIPDIGGLFAIHGQRYVCRRLTAVFSDSGMSEVLKGEFYRVIS